MSRFYFQKYIYAGIFLFAVFFLSLLFLFMTRERKEERREEVVPTRVLLTPTKYPILTDVIPTFTGAKEGDFMPEEEKTMINSAFDLRQILPIRQDGFYLDFDYGEDKFKVTIDKPYDVSYQNFRNWLSEKGFTAIDEDKFIVEER